MNLGSIMSYLNFESIIIVTYGRSGSTLLQGLLNAVPEILVKGENMNYFYHIFKSHKHLCNAASQFGGRSSNPTNPWFGINSWNETKILNHYREIAKDLILGPEISNPRSPIKCYGFKEIRFFNVPIDELEDYLDFLTKIFPNPCFLFNSRNLDNVVKSEWWKKKDESELRKKMINFEDKCKEYAINKPNCKLVTYENICLNKGQIEKIYDLIGTRVDKKIINKVLSTKHSYSTMKMN